MLKIIDKQKQELITGLADLYIKKENIEKQIDAQKVAIEQCNSLIRAIGEGVANNEA
jgi:mannitol/fructose-specific phosphotransferase system IIA component (Ntr-type)